MRSQIVELKSSKTILLASDGGNLWEFGWKNTVSSWHEIASCHRSQYFLSLQTYATTWSPLLFWKRENSRWPLGLLFQQMLLAKMKGQRRRFELHRCLSEDAVVRKSSFQLKRNKNPATSTQRASQSGDDVIAFPTWLFLLSRHGNTISGRPPAGRSVRRSLKGPVRNI